MSWNVAIHAPVFRERSQRGMGWGAIDLLGFDPGSAGGAGERDDEEAGGEKLHGLAEAAGTRVKTYTMGRLRVLRSSVSVSTAPLAESL